MVHITKDEAFYLRKCGRGKDIHMSSRTHQNRKRYWATESYKTMKYLDGYREEQLRAGQTND